MSKSYFCSWPRQQTDKRSIANSGCHRHTLPAIWGTLSVAFSKSMERFCSVLWAEKCLKCSAHSSGCVRHPRACPQTSSGASRWHLGTRSRVLSACRTNPSVAGTSKWCPTCKPSCPPVRGLFFQKGHVFHCSSHCQGDRAPLAFFKPKCLGCWQHEAWAFSEISWVNGELQ